MREVVGPLLLLGGFLIVGETVLLALGLTRGAAGAVRAAGMALVVGWAATVTAVSVALSLGAAPTPGTALVAGAAVLVIAAAVFRLARPPVVDRPWLREHHPAAKALALAAQVVAGGYLLALLVRSWEPTGVLHADAWTQWLPKAKLVYYFGGLDTGEGGWTTQLNPDYPPLHAASEALAFHALGGAEPLDLARVHWTIAAAFVAALAWMLAPRVRPAILWPCLALLVLAPKFGWLLASSLADEPLAMFVALAGLSAARWLESGYGGHAVLCGLFLAASTLTKNEGLMLSLVIVVALGVASRGGRPLVLAGLAATTLAAYGVWKLWLIRHDVPPNAFYDLGDALRPGYLIERGERLEYGLDRLLTELFTPSRWLLLVPATIVLAALVYRQARAISTFVSLVVGLQVLGFAAVYWLSAVDLRFYVDNTVDRVPAFAAMFCGALLPLLLQEAVGSGSPVCGRTAGQRNSPSLS